MDAAIVEAIKGAVQLTYLLMEMAGMDEKQQSELLDKERARFNENRAPLPEV